MATPAQIAANRLNAQKSTGPKTAAGKSRSALNALLHGFRSLELLLTAEEQPQFEQFKANWEQLYPVRTEEEQGYLTAVINSAWKYKRAMAMETGYLNRQVQSLLQSHPEVTLQQVQTQPKLRAEVLATAALSQDSGKQMMTLARYQDTLDRAMHRNLRALKKAIAARPPIDTTEANPAPIEEISTTEANPVEPIEPSTIEANPAQSPETSTIEANPSALSAEPSASLPEPAPTEKTAPEPILTPDLMLELTRKVLAGEDLDEIDACLDYLEKELGLTEDDIGEVRGAEPKP